MDNPIILSIVIILFTSALYFFIARFVLYFYLTKKGVKIIFGLTGIPGYIENIYWKSDQGLRTPGFDKLIFSLIVSFFIALVCASSLFLIKHYQGG
jgi:hypothetical protein